MGISKVKGQGVVRGKGVKIKRKKTDMHSPHQEFAEKGQIKKVYSASPSA
jgi:hypothetical protein